jgi:bla regulator protein BlaR1
MISTFSTFSSPASREICNHLWQSTLFALVVTLLALALRKYPARARYWLWMAASAKFLVPFALLIAAGGHLARPAHAIQTSAYIAIDEMSQPFASGLQTISIPSQPTTAYHILTLSTVLAAVWLCGLLVVLTRWLIQWSRVASTIRNATPLREGRVVEILRRIERLAGIPSPISILSSSGSMEPGVFGVLRPVLLWPEAISPHLDDVHLEAVLAHEAAHVRRRDNLTSLLHMLVEAIFWFHPLVWWMESQLVKERERACDEEVLLLCKQPRVYAESILKVCEICIEFPLTCVSGITGADLKQRVGQIMTAATARKLGPAAKLLLLAAGLLVAAVPVLAGRGRAMRSLSSVIIAPRSNALPEKPSVDDAELPSPNSAEGMLSGPPALAAQVSPPAAIPTPAKLPEFEVATIKPNDPSSHGGALAWTQTTRNELKIMGSLKFLIKYAYGIEDVQISGGPKWLDSDLFDVDAKASSLFASPAEMKLMLRALLQQRFQLSAHTETNALPVYSLVVAKTGAKLERANAFSVAGYGNGPTMVRGTLDTAQLAHLLTPVLGRTVVDNTGLHGNYKMDITWAADDQPSGPSLFTVIQEQLGLKLESTKGPVEVLVIDSAQMPSEN